MKIKRLTAFVLIVIFAVSISSCGKSGKTDLSTTVAATTSKQYTVPEHIPSTVEGKSIFNNIDYTVFVPSSYNVSKKIPMVMALHGGGQGTFVDALENRNLFAEYTGLNECAEKYGFIVVYPRQSTKNHLMGYDYWNWYIQKTRNSDEPKALYAIVNEVKGDYNIDDDRVFVCGLSAGAAMSQIMAICYTDVFSGCCCVAGITYKSSASLYEITSVQENGPTIDEALISERISYSMNPNKKLMKLLVVTGTDDTTVSPKNSLTMARTWASAMNIIDSNVNLDVATEEFVGIDSIACKKSTYATIDGEPLSVCYEIETMGHCWPGSKTGVSIGVVTKRDYGFEGGISLNEVMCEYFGLNK